jgi:hypothetical protein
MLGLWEGHHYDCHKDIKLVKAQFLIDGATKRLSLPLPLAPSLPSGMLLIDGATKRLPLLLPLAPSLPSGMLVYT